MKFKVVAFLLSFIASGSVSHANPAILAAGTAAVLASHKEAPPKAVRVIVLTKDNTLTLTDVVDSQSVAVVMKAARKLDGGLFENTKPMYLFLNTPGGSIEDGLRLIDFLNGLRRPIHTITAFAASMGFQIVEQLGERYILPHGIMMSHRARGSVAGEFGGVSPNQLESRLRLWSAVIEDMDKHTVSRTKGKQTLSSYQHNYVPEFWATANESVAAGFSDEVVIARCDSSLSGSNEHKADFMGMGLKYYTDKCPLNTGVSDVSAEIKTTQGSVDVDYFSKNGGSFGAECLVMFATNPSKLCALDTTLDLSRVSQIKQTFIDNYSGVDSKPMF